MYMCVPPCAARLVEQDDLTRLIQDPFLIVTDD